MSRAIKKVAKSHDPRDWHYMTEWQRWDTAMPPYQYRHTIPGWPLVFPGVPPFATGAVIQRLGALDPTASVGWFIDHAVGPLQVLVYSVVINIYPPELGLLDPGGQPYTCAIAATGYSMASINWFGQIWENLPPYDKVFDVPLYDILGNVHPDFPNGLRLTPVIWNEPITP